MATTRLLRKEIVFVFDERDEDGEPKTQTFEFSRTKSKVKDTLEKHGKKATAEVVEALEEEGFGDDELDEEDEDALDDDDDAGKEGSDKTSGGKSGGNKLKMKERTRMLWGRYTKDRKLAKGHAVPTKYRISFVHKDQYGDDGDNSPAFDVAIVDEAHCLRNRRSFAHQFIRLLERRSFCPVTASPTLNGIKDLRGIASLIRKTSSFDKVMQMTASHTADEYLRAPEINPFEPTEYDFQDADNKQQTKNLPSLFKADFIGTPEYDDLKAWYEADPQRRQIHLLMDDFLSLLTQEGDLTNKVVQGLNNTIIMRRQMTTLLTVPKELSGGDKDEQTFPGADIPPPKTVTIDVSHPPRIQKEVHAVMDDLLEQLHTSPGEDNDEFVAEDWDYGEGGESAEDSVAKISMHVDRLAQLTSFDLSNYSVIMDREAQERDPMSRFDAETMHEARSQISKDFGGPKKFQRKSAQNKAARDAQRKSKKKPLLSAQQAKEFMSADGDFGLTWRWLLLVHNAPPGTDRNQMVAWALSKSPVLFHMVDRILRNKWEGRGRTISLVNLPFCQL